MSLKTYTNAAYFKIGNQYNPTIADGYDGDRLTIVENPVGSKLVTFIYAPLGPLSKGYWASAKGTYDELRDIITGTIDVGELRGYFSIALDRKLPQPPGVDETEPSIHVYVRAPGGAPDEGSFTGQGN